MNEEHEYTPPATEPDEYVVDDATIPADPYVEDLEEHAARLKADAALPKGGIHFGSDLAGGNTDWPVRTKQVGRISPTDY